MGTKTRPEAEPIVIRPAKESDAEGIARAIRDSYSRIDAHHIPFDMPLYHAETHREAMRDPATRWAVAAWQGIVVGVAMWRLVPGIAHLHQLFVAGSHQGHGHGRRLLRHYQARALEEQPDTRLFTLHCLRDSHWALRFYRRHGFTVYEPGDEWRVPDLHLWIDACRRHDNGWPLREDKALLYKRAGS